MRNVICFWFRFVFFHVMLCYAMVSFAPIALVVLCCFVWHWFVSFCVCVCVCVFFVFCIIFCSFVVLLLLFFFVLFCVRVRMRLFLPPFLFSICVRVAGIYFSMLIGCQKVSVWGLGVRVLKVLQIVIRRKT